MKEKMKQNLFKMSDTIENRSVCIALRKGLIMLIPTLMVGSIALMIMHLPIDAWKNVLPKILDGALLEILDFIYKSCFQLFSVLLAITICICYVTNKKEKQLTQNGLEDCIILSVVTVATLAGYSGIQYADTFGAQSLGTTNTFSAIIIAMSSCYLYFLIKERKIFRVKNAGADADRAYLVAVDGILPAVLILAFFAVIHQLFRWLFDVNTLQELMALILEKCINSDSRGILIGALMLFVEHTLWFFGIHGGNVLEPINQKFETIEQASVYSKSFHDIFVIMGGCGTALCLVFSLLIFARKKNLKKIAKLACPSVVFNISELVVFGIPVIFNPIFLIPHILVPMACYFISYFAIYIGLVPYIVKSVDWTAPVILSGYQATGSVAGSLLQIVCITAGVFIYRPFIRLYEERLDQKLAENVKDLVKELQAQEEANTITSLTARHDALGNVARMLAADLKEAIEKNQLYLMYQPQVDEQEACIGAEALMRWNHPIVGMVYPPLIIQLAKETNMLSKMEEMLFNTAADAIKQIQEKVPGEFKISINITNESLAWEGFETCLAGCVKKHEIPGEKLWLEITEQDALSSSVDISNKLNKLKENKHKFLIDDFGMGHTSLAYLQTNYFEIVKLDGSLTRDVLENKRNREIISSIVYLGQSLDFKIIAEYVETKEQRDKLAELGCNGFQGYLYSKPLLLADLIQWMQAHLGKSAVR